MTCWIYDLDGVVTHLIEKRITNPRLLQYFVQQLQKKQPVTINTGRGLPFIREKVMKPLLALLQHEHLPESLLHNFFAVGEKGNAWIEDEKDCFDMTTATPHMLSKRAKEILNKAFSDTMTFDATKRTMISTEFRSGISLATYAKEQKKLVTMFEKLLREEDASHEFKLDPNISAVDIEHKTAGKAKGTDRIIGWLKKRGIAPDTFIAFGDSIADIGTGQRLETKGKDFTFVFVGEPNILTSQPTFPVTFTKEKYDKGVIEFLEKNFSGQ